MSAAVLSGVGIFANTAQANATVKSSATHAEQVRGVLTVVDHQKGEVHLYDRDGNIMKQTVKNGKSYKVWEKAIINDELMYRIGTNKQWIPAKYTNWDNARVGGRVTVALPSKAAISNRQNYAGAVRVNYQGQGKVRLLNDQGKYVQQYAAKNSTWKVWEKATINDEPMYRIGTQSQWIPAKYVAPVQPAAKKSAPVVHTHVNTPVAKPAQAVKPAQNHKTVKPIAPVVNNGSSHNAKQVASDKPVVVTTPAKKNTTHQTAVKPSQAVKPAQPVVPSKPVTPAKPAEKPAQPVQNHNTEKPASSVVNTGSNHTDTTKPVVPSKPAVPTMPAKPNTDNQNTVKPSQPVKPAQPVTPSKPVAPSKPVQPAQPVKPVTPTTPATPNKPVTPAKPAQPSQPAQNQYMSDAQLENLFWDNYMAPAGWQKGNVNITPAIMNDTLDGLDSMPDNSNHVWLNLSSRYTNSQQSDFINTASDEANNAGLDNHDYDGYQQKYASIKITQNNNDGGNTRIDVVEY